MVQGNTQGIKKALLWQLEKHIGFTDKTSFISEETLAVMCDFTMATGREVSVFISRSGRVEAICVGDATTVPVLDLSKRRKEGSNQKIRCVHTHPNGVFRLSDVDISALKQNRYDCIVAVGVSHKGATGVQVCYLEGNDKTHFTDVAVADVNTSGLLEMIVQYDSVGKGSPEKVDAEVNNRCLTVCVGDKSSHAELKRLAETAGYVPVAEVRQNVGKPDGRYYVGVGKIEEIALAMQVADADTVIFDAPLNAIQHAAIAEKLGRQVVDRGMLILMIFDRHATTAEGRLQVKLARLKYTLPLLVGQGGGMSRQRGGLYAMGGGGETKLEVDRRRVRQQIGEVSEKLKSLENVRDLRRKKRGQSGIKSVTLLGYTNAGKSTLMNAISRADVLMEDKLFATLDSVSRNVWTEDGSYVLTDTVGFIRNLPHTFVEAFKSTLDEVRFADLLLHVVDASSQEAVQQMATVSEVLAEIGATAPVLTVYNKADKSDNVYQEDGKENCIYVSAKSGFNIELLKEKIKELLYGKKD